MLLVLLGKTCSGKTVIAKKLCEDYGFEKIVTYTTRPMRDGEIDGVDYHFISDEEFNDKICEEFFFEYKSYKVADGSTWYYGSALPDDLDEKNYVIILTPAGYKDLNRKGIKNISYYLSVENEVLKMRIISRGDDKEEAERRLIHDDKDFNGVKKIVDRTVLCDRTITIDGLAKNIWLDFKYDEGRETCLEN